MTRINMHTADLKTSGIKIKRRVLCLPIGKWYVGIERIAHSRQGDCLRHAPSLQGMPQPEQVGCVVKPGDRKIGGAGVK